MKEIEMTRNNQNKVPGFTIEINSGAADFANHTANLVDDGIGEFSTLRRSAVARITKNASSGLDKTDEELKEVMGKAEGIKDYVMVKTEGLKDGVVGKADGSKVSLVDRSKDKDIKVKQEEFFNYQDIDVAYYQVLLSKNRPKCCRFIWYVITAVLLIATGFMIYQLLKGYFDYASFNKLTSTWTDTVTLPAISICSPNKLNYTLLRQEFSKEDADTFINLMIQLEKTRGFNATKDRGLNTTVLARIDELDTKWDINRFFFMDPSLFAVFYGYDFLFAAKFILLSDDDYWNMQQPAETGWCLELNNDGKLDQQISGSAGGFTIDLNANVAHYLTSTSSAGFIVFIRNHGETVMLSNTGYHIEPGKEIFMKIEKSEVSRLSKPYGHCADIPSEWADHNVTQKDPDYKVPSMTARECSENKRFTLMAKYCECLPWYLVDRINNTLSHVSKERLTREWAAIAAQQMGDKATFNVSDPSFSLGELSCSLSRQLTCDKEVQDKMNADGSDICDESCKFDSYSVSLTSSSFPPTEEYYNTFIAPDLSVVQPEANWTYAQNNLIRLHIFYGELKETKVTQEKAYEVQNFIAEFGGTVDLLIDISFFTVFQTLEISFAYIIFKCCRRKPKEQPLEEMEGIGEGAV